MGDIALVWDVALGNADFTLTDGDLTSEDGLRTAAMLSLFIDRRANIDDDLPGDSLGGWWGDQFLEDTDDLLGSRLWLLDRAKMRPGIEDETETYCREALQWMLDDSVASSIAFDSQRDGDTLLFQVEIFHGDTSTRFEHVWDGEAARFVPYYVRNPVTGETRITEAGDTRITEAGDTRVTEG